MQKAKRFLQNTYKEKLKGIRLTYALLSFLLFRVVKIR